MVHDSSSNHKNWNFIQYSNILLNVTDPGEGFLKRKIVLRSPVQLVMFRLMLSGLSLELGFDLHQGVFLHRLEPGFWSPGVCAFVLRFVPLDVHVCAILLVDELSKWAYF